MTDRSQAQAQVRRLAEAQTYGRSQTRTPGATARVPQPNLSRTGVPGAAQPFVPVPRLQVNRIPQAAPPVVDTFNVSLDGIQRWYDDITHRVGTLAAMQDDDANRATSERALDHSLHQLVEAVRQRKKLIPDMPRDQLFDLNIMIGHVLQLKIGVTRLAPGR